MINNKTWTLVTDQEESIYDLDYVKCPVYAKKFGPGTVFVQDKGSFTFTCSFGHSSDKSYTGCFYEVKSVVSVHDAMRVLDASEKEIRGGRHVKYDWLDEQGVKVENE